jgi:hypothetical protein
MRLRQLCSPTFRMSRQPSRRVAVRTVRIGTRQRRDPYGSRLCRVPLAGRQRLEGSGRSRRCVLRAAYGHGERRGLLSGWRRSRRANAVRRRTARQRPEPTARWLYGYARLWRLWLTMARRVGAERTDPYGESKALNFILLITSLILYPCNHRTILF